MVSFSLLAVTRTHAIAILILCAAMLAVWPGQARSGKPLEETRGTVAQVQLIDASALGEGLKLIIRLENDSQYVLPGVDRIAAGRGVHVEIEYLRHAEPGEIPEACSVRVTGVPTIVDGEQQLVAAERPFRIYRNDRPECL